MLLHNSGFSTTTPLKYFSKVLIIWKPILFLKRQALDFSLLWFLSYSSHETESLCNTFLSFVNIVLWCSRCKIRRYVSAPMLDNGLHFNSMLLIKKTSVRLAHISAFLLFLSQLFFLTLRNRSISYFKSFTFLYILPTNRRNFSLCSVN